MNTSKSIEYSVYTFDGRKSGKRDATWHKALTSKDMHHALKTAQNLFGTNKFGKVEVKKKYYDEKNDRTIDMSIKTYEKKKKGVNIFTILFSGIILAVIAFFVTYYTIGQQ